jgi:hypothetical protein
MSTSSTSNFFENRKSNVSRSTTSNQKKSKKTRQYAVVSKIDKALDKLDVSLRLFFTTDDAVKTRKNGIRDIDNITHLNTDLLAGAMYYFSAPFFDRYNKITEMRTGEWNDRMDFIINRIHGQSTSPIKNVEIKKKADLLRYIRLVEIFQRGNIEIIEENIEPTPPVVNQYISPNMYKPNIAPITPITYKPATNPVVYKPSTNSTVYKPAMTTVTYNPHVNYSAYKPPTPSNYQPAIDKPVITPSYQCVPNKNVTTPSYQPTSNKEVTTPSYQYVPGKKVTTPSYQSTSNKEVTTPSYQPASNKEVTTPSYQYVPTYWK